MSLKSKAIWAASPSTTRGQPTPLSSDSKGERIAYASGRSIFVRSIDNPAETRQYTSHAATTTVARFSPSGFYVASGDISGTVRVWDCVGEGVTKGEYQIIAGPINDLAWDGDSQRIIAVGQGRERMGHCITWDSGNTVGEISGHSNQINTVAIRQQRPLRAATGSDDNTLAFFHGTPFKFNVSLRGNHERFVFGTAFSPDGSTLVSVGADRRIWLYDGKTGEQRKQIGNAVHIGSIFSVAWSQDSKQIATASADQTVRLWDVEAGKNTTTWRMGDEAVVSIPHQQVGLTWPANRTDGLVISVDLDGNLNYLTPTSQKPSGIIKGHQKNITAVSLSQSTFFTGSYDGRLSAWDISTGLAAQVEGDSHHNQVAGIAVDKQNDRVLTVGWDDTLRSISSNTFAPTMNTLSSQPKGVAVSSSSRVYVVTSESVAIYKDGQAVGSVPVKGATSIAASDAVLAVGHDDKSIKIFSLDDSTSLPTPTSHHLQPPTAAISALAFSPDGKLLAAGASNGKILVYDTASWDLLTDRWGAHTARITSIAWAPDSLHAVSGSLDTNVHVWSVKDPSKRINATGAHKHGVNGVAWHQNGTILSTGADATVKTWTL